MVMTLPQFRAFYEQLRAKWRLPQGLRPEAFVTYLEDANRLHRIRLSAAEHGTVLQRFVLGAASPFAIALSIRPNSYLSHGTAAALHGLTEQFAKVLYVNKEQTPKPSPKGGLTQESINRAFKGRQRTSTYVFHFDIYRAVLINGKNTGNLGIEERPTSAGDFVPVTGLARTLVDISVRPSYAGGVVEVLSAFRAAQARAAELAPEAVASMLAELDYIYPYHQAVGFYMERAGFSEAHLRPLKDRGTQFDFYLAYGLTDLVFDKTWRLHHPRGL